MATIIITLYPFLCMFLPCLFYMIICSRKPEIHLNKSHFLWCCIFLCYLSLVLNTTGIGTIWDIGKYDSIMHIDKINFIPLQYGIDISQILNIIMFMPFGFLLPLIWKNCRSLFPVLMSGFSYSLAIEFCQLFNNRVTDVNDLIMNTLGAVCGYLIWVIYQRLFHQKAAKKEVTLSIREPFFYLAFSILGQFFLYNWRWMVMLFYEV